MKICTLCIQHFVTLCFLALTFCLNFLLLETQIFLIIHQFVLLHRHRIPPLLVNGSLPNLILWESGVFITEELAGLKRMQGSTLWWRVRRVRWWRTPECRRPPCCSSATSWAVPSSDQAAAATMLTGRTRPFTRSAIYNVHTILHRVADLYTL